MLSGDNTRILERAACEVNNEMVINLGIGLPQLIPNFISEDSRPLIHSENGISRFHTFSFLRRVRRIWCRHPPLRATGRKKCHFHEIS